MANLSITNVCNRNCVYCFANDTRFDLGKSLMGNDMYDLALDYLVRSNIKQARLLGGEPTLHPQFIKFVNKAFDKGLSIMLFTNGLVTEEILDFLSSAPADRLSILLNTIHPSEGDSQGINCQIKFMKSLGGTIMPGINIYNAGQDMEYLLDYVTEYNLRKEIRLGISHPVLSQKNIFLHPKEYKKIGYKIALLKQKALKMGISLGFDCGMVPCMFPSEYAELLNEELKKTGNCCNPVIDLLSDGSFIACYPLNNFLKIKINSNSSSNELIKEFNTALKPYINVGIYPYCSTCPLFNKICNGGCMSFRISRFTNCLTCLPDKSFTEQICDKTINI